MNFVSYLKNRYVQWHGESLPIPELAPSEVERWHVVFTGKVQKVGFRKTLRIIARRLQITGWVRNQGDRVEAEIQGEKNQIAFLVQALKNPKRARVDQTRIEKQTVLEKESDFEIRPSA